MSEEPFQVIDAAKVGAHEHPHDHPHDHPEIMAEIAAISAAQEAVSMVNNAENAAEESAVAAGAAAEQAYATQADLDGFKTEVLERLDQIAQQGATPIIIPE
ncbi:MAG: hypothetical protein ACRDNK_04190, partial [Solirubrobacteraceae bacterium]